MLVIKSGTSFEEVIKGSKFLSELFPCESQSQARDLVKAQKTKYPDATHVVHAFVIGAGAEILGMSDDGEPSGTAGRPTLDVLKGRYALRMWNAVELLASYCVFSNTSSVLFSAMKR